MVNVQIGKIYRIVDVPTSQNCLKCVPCLKLKIMEIGLISGEKIMIEAHHLGLWIVNVLSDNENVVQRIAMREDEFERLLLEEV